MAPAPLAALPEHDLTVYRLGPRLLVCLDCTGRDDRDLPSAMPAHAPVVVFLARTLGAAGLLYSLQGRLLTRIADPDRWYTPPNWSALAAALTHRVDFLYHRGPLTFDTISNSTLDHPERAARHLPNCTVLPDCGPLLARALFDSAAPYCPALTGIVNHPVHDTPRRPWLSVYQPGPAPVTADYDYYHHLRALFSGLDLDPASHAALHIFLLGALHAHSLDYERPILLVDSWVRGRGKSEVNKALSVLIDGEAHEYTQSNRDTLHETVIAGLGTGRRVVALDNLDGRRNYNNPFFASLSTGSINGRKKYAAENSTFTGTLLLLNTVYGAASLHRDLLDRMLRCELRGPARPLSPRPQEYAPAHRDAILAECVHALGAIPSIPHYRPLTRFAPFESVAVAAYAHVFNLLLCKVEARLLAMQTGARSLLAAGPPSLHQFNPSLLDCPHEAVTAPTLHFLPLELEGAIAVGHIFTNGKWQQIQEIS